MSCHGLEEGQQFFCVSRHTPDKVHWEISHHTWPHQPSFGIFLALNNFGPRIPRSFQVACMFPECDTGAGENQNFWEGMCVCVLLRGAWGGVWVVVLGKYWDPQIRNVPCYLNKPPFPRKKISLCLFPIKKILHLHLKFPVKIWSKIISWFIHFTLEHFTYEVPKVFFSKYS